MMKQFIRIILFVFFFSPLIRVGPLSVNTAIVLSLISIIWLFFLIPNTQGDHRSAPSTEQQSNGTYITNNQLIRLHLGKIVQFIMIPILLGFFYIVVIAAIRGNFIDTSFIERIIYGLLILPTSLLVYRLYLQTHKDRAWQTFVKDLTTVNVWHILLTIVMFLSPAITQFVDLIFNLDNTILLQVQYRHFGISSYGGAVLSTVYSMVLIITLQFSSQNSKNNFALTTLQAGIIFIGIMLSGRSGLVILALAIPYLFWVKTRNLSYSAIYRSIYALTAGFIVTSVGVLIILLIAQNVSDTIFDSLNSVLRRSFEFYFKLRDSGELSTSSTDDILGSHFFYPESQFDFIFGTGNFGRPNNGPALPTDPGVIRAIWGSGVIGLILLFAPNLGFLRASRLFKNKDLKYFLWFIVLIMSPVLNFKEFFFLGVFGFTHILWLVLYFGLDSRYRTGPIKIQSTPLNDTHPLSSAANHHPAPSIQH